MQKPLNLFYAEPDPDRWFLMDRYLRQIIRRMVRGKQRPGGVMMVALNLMQGLDRLKIPYRFNDYRYIDKHPDEIACIIGKPQLLTERKWKNPVVFGAGIFSHPSEEPELFSKYPNVKRLLVPGEWMRSMFEPFYGDKVQAWPTGIDTKKWSPVGAATKDTDFIVYDKIRWERDKHVPELLDPILEQLQTRSLSYTVLKYGSYEPEQLLSAVGQAKAAIFLCEHETQGLAYQQILAAGLPILAWDRGGYWQDPYYYPAVKFGPVSSVPYWDDRCGIKFGSIANFDEQLQKFIKLQDEGAFSPRNFITENLSLEKCAADYVDIISSLEQELLIQ
ncbi:glycosyltransferase [Mucilaginibacter myungsuensis]|uniref:Glycosyltransferase n=1 Tax=Mucilaginibacter myungsuensis TaxID=649104 RepID=A0A929KUS6_9SPHI|nr:glycosyltransferase [Mucilaginibacter myungsuensis]MBE9660835.1 glycosyltransferase [Mucilaginibacter myungsuensis]MDN3600882.1 glycosyltransferase [Mucilaginibacter myungsuensis]